MSGEVRYWRSKTDPGAVFLLGSSWQAGYPKDYEPVYVLTAAELAAVKAEAKVEAMRSLADVMDDWATTLARPVGSHFARLWARKIRARADQIEEAGRG